MFLDKEVYMKKVSVVWLVNWLLLAIAVSVLVYTRNNLQHQIEILRVENRVTRDAFAVLSRTNWVFKDVRLTATGTYDLSVASLDKTGTELDIVTFAVNGGAFRPYTRGMGRYGQPRALRGKRVTFRFPVAPPYGDNLVFGGLLEFSIE